MANAAIEKVTPAVTGKKEAKDKLAPVPKPNEKEYKGRIDAETKAIDEIKAKINELQQRITSMIGGRDEYNRKKQEMRARLDELQVQMDKYEGERKKLIEAIDSRQKEGLEMKQSVQDMRRKLGFSTTEEIDRRIAALEHSMMTSTLTLKEEKKLLDQIKQLKHNRPLVGKFAGLEAGASSFEETSVVPLRAMLDEARTKLLELRAMKREEQEKYFTLVKQRQEATAPGRELIEERDKLSKQMTEHMMKRREIQDEYKKENWKYQAYLAQQRQERNEKMKEERMRRQVEQERANLERQLEMVDEEPVDGEIVLLTQTIAYVQKIIDDHKQQTQEDSTAKQEKSVVEAPKGDGVALLPKNQREEEYFFAPKAMKKKNDGGIKKTKPKSIKHDIGTLLYFEQCGVAAPVFEADLEPCMKLLEEKLDAAKALQATKAARVEARRQEIQKELDAIDARANAGLNGAEKREEGEDEANGEEEEAE
ncbi:Brf1p family coiled coil protein [Besnoitia besnoiti]|uniref:Brf1p family coiled coil protein n=1 Tax=Besnoitia besnoiti TaxID=94643 RepID=A0A2A9MKT7_BESBE|nr:Brf1p family coiled coil protein [Besnoitia besnoiti]PFH38569.1 Brf1p family coiled coil protein [Besnoitia besnoiti]